MEEENNPEKNELEKQKLEEAAESLKKIEFNQENYKAILEIIQKIQQLYQPHSEEIEKEAHPITPPEENLAPVSKLTENEEKIESNTPENIAEQEAVVFEKTTLPPFLIMTDKGLTPCENYKVISFDQAKNTYLLDNGEQQLSLPAKTFETIISPESAYPKKENKNTLTAKEGPAIVEGKTIIPEFSMFTQNGLETFKDMMVKEFNPSDNSYLLANETTTLTVSADTFKEMTKAERFEKEYDENTPAYEKMLESQYNDFFKPRDNTANNFRHNLSVYCRKEANSPLDALKIAKEIVSRMDKEEQKKTKRLLEQVKKDDQSINECIVSMYFDAINTVPLNEEYIKDNFPDKRIARPFYDTISSKGMLVDPLSSLRIGDTIKNIPMKTSNVFGKGKSKIYENLTIVSASKEGNNIILMDKNKSFYELPRDEFLEGFNKQQNKQHSKQHNKKGNRDNKSNN